MFSELGIGYQRDRARRGPRRRIYLRVGNRKHHLEQSVVEPLITFLDAHFVAVRIAAGPLASCAPRRRWSNPRSIVIAVRFHDERIALPPAHRISEVPRNRRIRREFAPVGPDVPPGVPPLDEL